MYSSGPQACFQCIFVSPFKASVEHNALELKQYIEEIYWGSGKPVMLLGHSKGGIDAAAALSIYWPDLKDKVAGLALVQSPYGGTPIASDILREGQIGDKETRRIMELLICKIIKVTISCAINFVPGVLDLILISIFIFTQNKRQKENCFSLDHLTCIMEFEVGAGREICCKLID